jgi:hypothetical protein
VSVSSKREIVVARKADADGVDRGAAVAVERGTQSEASCDQATCVSKRCRLARWTEIRERRVLCQQGNQRGAQSSVENGEDRKLRSTAQIDDERAWPRR